MYTSPFVKACLSFLINNAYFRVGNAIFRQTIGIPIGSDPAPLFANLFLFHYESEWIRTISRVDFVRARRLFNTFRFIDDLIALNDHGEFSRTFKEIYPSELVLNRENEDDQSGTYLALEINIVSDEFNYKLFDKRDAFSFFIVRFPYYSSNMPAKMFFSTISAEILRICRASAHYGSFIKACDPFMKRMTNQGAVKNKVRISLNKLLSRHFTEFNKFGFNKEQLINEIVNLL